MTRVGALVLVLLLATLETASGMEVPTQVGFEFNGQHSNFAQQYYTLYTARGDTAPLADVVLPSDLQDALRAKSLKWTDLPGLLQRAFLWDAGYALTPAHALARVYTRCGRSMAEVTVPPKAFERVGCRLKACNGSDGSTFHRSLPCKALNLFRVVQCAVEAPQDVSAPSYAAIWGDGGSAETLPEVTVHRHAYVDDDGTPSFLFALHTTLHEVADTQCPVTPAMVIPCAPYHLVNQSKFCPPVPGALAPAWLNQYAAEVKGDKTWLVVPLCIVTFVTFGAAMVYRYKSALRHEARKEVDRFLRENKHLFDNGAVEAFLVPKHKSNRLLQTSRTTRSSQDPRSSSHSASSDSGYSSRASSLSRSRPSGLDETEPPASDKGSPPAAAFDGLEAARGLSASAFDLVASDAGTSRKNELVIQSFRVFESHRKIRRLRIPLGELQLLRPLSHGTTGEVWLALHHSHRQVAVKQLVPEKRRVMAAMELFLAEIYLLAQLKHPHIVTLTGIAWNTLEHVLMVQEYMEGGDLQHVLAQQRAWESAGSTCGFSGTTVGTTRSGSLSGGHPLVDDASVTAATSSGSFGGGFGAAAGGLLHSHTNLFTWSKHKLAIAQDITSALAYLHGRSPKVLHRDLKSRNVLLSSSLTAKVCDFGNSRRHGAGHEDETTLTTMAAVGTLPWTAPELLLGEEYTEKVDIYSLGIVLSELDTCLLPYRDPVSHAEQLLQHPLRLMRCVIEDGRRPQLSPDCPLPITHLIAACLSRNPKLRPSAAEVGAWLASARGERLLLHPHASAR
ncbi:hypothetical protein PsorP6_006892 [Peronosclerospora sorghi]|uniref:Uncharacterized protein n=1 Tax=Peronosclerospora sorghi TaxID=230839 RepID=A0ACC0W8W9_9STRA|nr:hypothetical protein PsorP6_006892 [Peronosclerospora sorghi]